MRDRAPAAVRLLPGRLQLSPCLATGLSAIALLCSLAFTIDPPPARRLPDTSGPMLRGALSPSGADEPDMR